MWLSPFKHSASDEILFFETDSWFRVPRDVSGAPHLASNLAADRRPGSLLKVNVGEVLPVVVTMTVQIS